MKNTISRREFFRLAGWGALALAASGGAGSFLAGCSASPGREDRGYPPAVAATGLLEQADLEIALQATPVEVNLFPDRATRLWTYEGQVLSGGSNALQPLPGSYLGPILRVKKGQRVRVRFENRVDEPTIVHWHGLHVPPEMDGHPRNAIHPGGTYAYEFQVNNRAGTYWFHPHPHTLTGPQVYRGLAGLFLVSDEEENAAGLPSDEFDLPLVIQDRAFDANNQLVYLANGMMDGSGMGAMLGFLGDQILVNGQPDFTLPVARRAYRLRLLNGSNSRIYKLAWEDGIPLTVIASDGGLLEKPVQCSYITLGPAERVEIWVDFAGWDLGHEVRLVSLPFTDASMGGMMGGGMIGPGRDGNSLANGAEFPILTIKIEREAGENSSLPAKLSALERYQEVDSVNRRRPRLFRLGMGGMGGMMGGGMNWAINGRVFEMNKVARDEIVRLNTQETWLFDNTATSGGMGMMGGMMQMAHPMHIHGAQFQVIDRQVLPAYAEAWETVREGYVDEGWKDTVLVMPGEQVKVLLRFQDYSGVYLNHCHNLEHEDLGMMRNYRIDP